MANEPYSTQSANMGVSYVSTPNIWTFDAACDRARKQSRETGKMVSVHDSQGREVATFYDGQTSGKRTSY